MSSYAKSSYPGFGKAPTSPFTPAQRPTQPAMGGNTQPAGGAPSQRSVAQPAGQAQPTPTPSQGTKYGAYSPPTSQATGDPRGAYANFAPSQRPPPFQMSAAQTPWGQSMDPFAERDAFVQQIGNQRMNNQIAFNTSGPNAPQGSPFINYDMARQNAGLSGGAPSMSPEYGDSMIGRLNQSFGGQGNPLAYQQPQVTPSQPYVDQQGQRFLGSMSFAPGTSQDYQNQAYGKFANEQGYYQNPGSAQPQQAPAYYPGGPGGFPTQPQRPGSAQPIAQPPQGTAYYPGGPGGFPPPQPGLRSANDSPTSPEYQKWRSGQTQTMQWLGPEGEAKREADLHRRWLEETGRAPASGDFRPPPQRPGNAQPISQPPQGTPYNPVAAPPREGASRIDPSTGKPVTYSNGQWSWSPNPVSGSQPYDPVRFGDQPQSPAPPRGQPTFSAGPGGPQAPSPYPPPPTDWYGPDSPQSPEYQAWRRERFTDMRARSPEEYAAQERAFHQQWLAETGRTGAQSPTSPAPPPAPPKPKSRISGGDKPYVPPDTKRPSEIDRLREQAKNSTEKNKFYLERERARRQPQLDSLNAELARLQASARKGSLQDKARVYKEIDRVRAGIANVKASLGY
jgi:hypothetical protein